MKKAIRNSSAREGHAWFWVAVLFVVLATTPAFGASDEAKRLLALIDYIGGDYRNAVEHGTIINGDEYAEMTEFSRESLDLFGRLKTAAGDTAGIESDLRALARHIREKTGDDEVPRLAGRIKQRLVAAYHIITNPRSIPAYHGAKTLYGDNCAQCHGSSGAGDGPGASTMRPRAPKPANFLDPDLVNNLSPFKAFNTVSFGIQGTAMPSFSALHEEQRWGAAFYIFSLRFSAEDAAAGRKIFATRDDLARLARPSFLATATDDELKHALAAELPEADAPKVLAYLRRGILEEPRFEPLLTAQTYLKEAVDLYQAGNTTAAYQRAVDAYLDGFELAEPALFAKDASFARNLESLFTELRGAMRSGTEPARVRDLYGRLDAGLAQALDLLERKQTESRLYTFFNSSLIIIREGLEAALIVSAIIAVLKATGALQAIRYIHLGWVLAVLSGILTWVLAQTALTVSGAQREVVEGLTALLAAAVLFSVSYWLISKAEAKKWQRYIETKVQEALSGRKIAALTGVSFLAVYREAFETVLFYQALWLQTPSTRGFVLWGFLAGLVVMAVLVWSLFKLGMKIPLRLFFGVSSALLYLLALVFLGDGIRDLQATGWLSETPLPAMPQLPFLGIYATLETLAAQLVLVVALLAAIVWLWGGSAQSPHNA
jgi:high-affinity iron transporter